MLSDANESVQSFADSCIRCGLCTQTNCGMFQDGTTTLGDVCEAILSGDTTHDSFPFACALCNRCIAHCPVDLRASDAMKPARSILLDKYPSLEGNFNKFRVENEFNFFTMMKSMYDGDESKVTKIVSKPTGNASADRTAFFPGCSLFAYAPRLVEKTFNWLREKGYASHVVTVCCGAPLDLGGFADRYNAHMDGLLNWLKDQGIDSLILVCPDCNEHFEEPLQRHGFNKIMLPDVLLKEGMVIEGGKKVAIHDSCYDRFSGEIGKSVRKLLANSEIVKLPHEYRDALCCGGGGLVSGYAPDMCDYRRLLRLQEFDALDLDYVVSACFSCVNSLQRSADKTKVYHYLELLFDEEIDWDKAYERVGKYFGDPKYQQICEQSDLMFS